MKVSLPSGGWAELRDTKQRPINNRERQRVAGAGEGDHGNITASFRVYNQLLVYLIESWSLELPLPSAFSGDPLDGPIGDLREEDADELMRHARQALPMLFPDFSPSPDPDSPTVPSNGSNGLPVEGGQTNGSLHLTSIESGSS